MKCSAQFAAALTFLLLSSSLSLADVASTPAAGTSLGDVEVQLPAYEPFGDEKPLVAALKSDPSRANRLALAALRRKYVAVLTSMANSDSKSAAFQRAILYAESAAKLDPQNIDGWMLYGATLLSAPDWPLTQSIAEEVFHLVLTLDQNNVDAGVYLGQALFNQQRFDAARAQWTQTYRLYPHAATPQRMGPLNMAIILSGEIEDGISLFRDLNAQDRWPHWMLAQGLLTKHMLDTTRDPKWKTEFAAIDTFFAQDVGEEAQYWADMKKKWAGAGKGSVK